MRMLSFVKFLYCKDYLDLGLYFTCFWHIDRFFGSKFSLHSLDSSYQKSFFLFRHYGYLHCYVPLYLFCRVLMSLLSPSLHFLVSDYCAYWVLHSLQLTSSLNMMRNYIWWKGKELSFPRQFYLLLRMYLKHF